MKTLRRMDKINSAVLRYQQIIGACDKHLLERSVEQAVLKSLHNATRKTAKINLDLIDVDLIRGSTFSKTKSQHGWMSLALRAALRVVFLPVCFRWWIRSTCWWLYVLLVLLYTLQAITFAVYLNDPENILSAESLSLAHLLSPCIMMFVLASVHSQIMATQVSSHTRHPHNHDNSGRDRSRSRSRSVSEEHCQKMSRDSKCSPPRTQVFQESACIEHVILNNLHIDCSNDPDFYARRNVAKTTRRSGSFSRSQPLSASGERTTRHSISVTGSQATTLDPSVARLPPQSNNSISSSTAARSIQLLRCESIEKTSAWLRRNSPEPSSVIPSDERLVSLQSRNKPSCRHQGASVHFADGVNDSANWRSLHENCEVNHTAQESCTEFTCRVTRDTGIIDDVKHEGESLMGFTEDCGCSESVPCDANNEIDDCPPTTTVSRTNSCSSLASSVEELTVEQSADGDTKKDQWTEDQHVDTWVVKGSDNLSASDPTHCTGLRRRKDCSNVDNRESHSDRIVCKEPCTSTDQANVILPSNCKSEEHSECVPYETRCDVSSHTAASENIGCLANDLSNMHRTPSSLMKNSKPVCLDEQKLFCFDVQKNCCSSSNTAEHPGCQGDCEEGDISVAIVHPVKRLAAPPAPLTDKIRERLRQIESAGISSCDSARDVSKVRRFKAKTGSEWEDTVNTDITSCSITSTAGTSASDLSETDILGTRADTATAGLGSPSMTSVMKNLASNNDRVSCMIWESSEVQKVDLTVLDIGWGIIEKVQNLPESCDYLLIGTAFSVLLMFLPVTYRVYHGKDQLENLNFHNFTALDTVVTLAFGHSWRQAVVIINGILQRLCLGLIIFFLLSVAERTFKQRLLHAKNFCYLTSSRRAKKYDLPHFRLNKVRNIKTWLSLRSFLKRRGPQRSVESIVSAAFLAAVILISIICIELMQDYGSFLDHLGNWELTMWCLFLGVFLMRYFTLGTKINKKYRNFSVLITEQINLYLHMEQKPHKKDELMLANSVLKLAEDLLKELECPFKVSGLTANPFLYNVTKVVVLSAFSAVLTEILGFKLKLYKIKIRG